MSRSGLGRSGSDSCLKMTRHFAVMRVTIRAPTVAALVLQPRRYGFARRAREERSAQRGMERGSLDVLRSADGDSIRPVTGEKSRRPVAAPQPFRGAASRDPEVSPHEGNPPCRGHSQSRRGEGSACTSSLGQPLDVTRRDGWATARPFSHCRRPQ